MNVEILEKIAGDNSRTFKESLIPELDEELRYFVRLALDDGVTFGVTVPDDAGVEEMWRRAPRVGLPGSEAFWVGSFKQKLTRLQGRIDTGAAAQVAVEEIIKTAPTALMAKWAGRIINRQLRAGFDIKTFNKCFAKEQHIKKFCVQLAETYQGEDDLVGEYIHQAKLDGNRVIGRDAVPLSRKNHEYPAAEHVIREITEKLGADFWKQWVPDGEMLGNLGFDQSSGALRRIAKGGVRRAEFTWWLFDLVRRDEWEARKTRPYRDRLADLTELDQRLIKAGVKYTKFLPFVVHPRPRITVEEAAQICDDYTLQGFEGVMFKKLDTPYCFDRSDAILKLKRFYEDEFRVTGCYEGEGRNKGRLGGVWVDGDIDWAPLGRPKRRYKIHSRVGSGFDDATRDYVWPDHQQEWMDAVVQVKFQEATAKGKLRFGVFKMRRKDKEGGRPLGGDASRPVSEQELREARARAAKRMAAEAIAATGHVFPPAPVRSGEVVKGKPMAELPDELPEEDE